MSWRVLRPQVKDLVASISTLSEVSATPKLKFSSYPAGYVIPADQQGAYETTHENIRQYAFTVRLFETTKDIGVEQAIENLEGIVDSVIDEFDQEDLRSLEDRTVGLDLPAAYTFLNIFASPSVWLEVPEEQLIMAEVMVQVQISVDVS